MAAEHISTLEIEDLHVTVNDRPVLKGIDLVIRGGEVHSLMGPNGSGKTTLSFALMGHPRYKIEKGAIRLDGRDLTGLPADERARAGLFLAFQYPLAIPGVTVANFLRQAVNSIRGEKVNVLDFHKELREKMAFLEMNDAFAKRYLNDGFSGGEKKRMETLQMLMLKPRFAILDETDSGLDVDALKVVCRGVNAMRGPSFGTLVITHYNRMLDYIEPDHVHVIVDGRIVRSGDRSLAEEIEEKGYQWVRELVGQEAAQGVVS